MTDHTDTGVAGAAAPLLPRRHLPWLVAALLVVGATFAPTLWFQLVSWDDPTYLSHNPQVVGGAALSWSERLLTPRLGYPMPVTMATYRAEHALFGLWPLPYHATNVLLHLGSCLLVFLVARRLGLGLPGALAALLLFGLHPVVAEPVSWITGRKDLLAGVLVLWATDEALRRPFSRRRPRSWLAPALFLLAGLSKPVALFLPAALVAWYVLLQRLPLRRALLAVSPMLLVAVAIFPAALLSHQAIGGVQLDAAPLELLRQSWYALGHHLGLLVLAITPSAKYLPHPWPPGFRPLVDLLPLAFAALLGLALWRLDSQRRRLAAATLAWAALAYLPSSNLIPLTRFLADSYLYLPLAGLAWLAGLGVDAGARRLAPGAPRRLGAVVGGIGVALLILLALVTSAKWESSRTLWSQVHERYPHDYRACRNLGNAHFEAGAPRLALAQYRRCAERYGAPAFEKNMAIALLELGRPAEARALFERVLERRPQDAIARRYLERLGAPRR